MREEDITLTPFTMNLEINEEIIVEKSQPIPFNQIKIDTLKGITFDLEKNCFCIENIGDYYLSYQVKTGKRYHLSIAGEVDFFPADLFPVADLSHGSGILTVTNPNTTFYLTCHSQDIKLSDKISATMTIFKVK